MSKTRVAIACQGGGSQTAFTAGALKALCEAQIAQNFEIVSISGTSGGAVCASLLWYGYGRGDRPVWKRLIEFWKDNTAQGLAEQLFNDAIVTSLRLIDRGWLPSFQISPSSPLLSHAMKLLGAGVRRGFLEFPELLRKFIDFDEIARWGARQEAPVLVVGAANITTGKLVKFMSNYAPIRLEHLLASCAVPTLFPAVMIEGQAYWDGLFSDNPPVEELVRPISVGDDNVPDEIWIIKINPTASHKVPLLPQEISDRRNQLEGNISLFQQLQHVEWINDVYLRGGLREDVFAHHGMKPPIRIPKAFADDPDKPFHIPWIEMPDALQDQLDYEGKLDRSARNIDWLVAEGEASARDFLVRRAKLPPLPAGNSLEELVMMANHAARFFLVQPGSDPVPRVAEHFERFWGPDRRARLVGHLAAGGAGLDEPVREAAVLLANADRAGRPAS